MSTANTPAVGALSHDPIIMPIWSRTIPGLIAMTPPPAAKKNATTSA